MGASYPIAEAGTFFAQKGALIITDLEIKVKYDW